MDVYIYTYMYIYTKLSLMFFDLSVSAFQRFEFPTIFAKLIFSTIK